jgi:hypothetical protein
MKSGMRHLLGLIIVLVFSVGGHAHAVSIIIQNNDGDGEGFNDGTPAAPVGGNTGITLGAQRMQVFQFAAQIWGQALTSNVPVVVEANFEVLPCDAGSAVLGGAGAINLSANFVNAPQALTWYHIALANALAGSDTDPANGDITATFNSAIDNNNACLNGTNWYLGLDNNGGSDIDLLAVVLHEIAHGLGFSTFANEATGTWLGNIPDVFGGFVRDNSLGLQWTQMDNAQRIVSAINTGNLVWTGAQVTASSGSLTGGTDGSGRVQLYVPNSVQPGSSISHWDTTATPSLLMEPFITGELASDLDLTDEQMVDIGWTIIDADGDGVVDDADNCPSDANPDQLNTDGVNDGGDACDSDDDNDNWLDVDDNCPLDFNPNQEDDDEDGIGDYCDPDYAPPCGGCGCPA